MIDRKDAPMNIYKAITINDSEQWIAVNGDPHKPLLLLLHGGPGTPCMTFFRKWNAPFLDDFLVVTWDQRGTGRSFNKSLDPSTLSVDQIVADTHTLTNYLKETFNKDKIYILGHSFGATVGLKVISEKPENYHAYFAVSQFINAEKNEAESYNWLLKEAEKRDDKKALRTLKKIGAPIDGFYKDGLSGTIKAKQIVSRYKGDSRQGSSSLSLIGNLFFSKEYGYHRFFNSLKSIQLSLGTIGFTLKGINYEKTIPEVAIPIYFFSGKYDQLTPQSILIDYYTRLKAPHKELIIFENSAHSPLWEENDKFHREIHRIMA